MNGGLAFTGLFAVASVALPPPKFCLFQFDAIKRAGMPSLGPKLGSVKLFFVCRKADFNQRNFALVDPFPTHPQESLSVPA